MKAQVVSGSAQDDFGPIVLDTFADPFNVGFAVTISSGATLTYKVQYSFDDPFKRDYATDYMTDANWIDHADFASGASATKDGNIAFPVRAVRLSITAYTDGSATLTVIQAG